MPELWGEVLMDEITTTEDFDAPEDRYPGWMDSMHQGLWVREGTGPPGDDDLHRDIRRALRGVVDGIDALEEDHDLSDTAESYANWVREDALKGLVALEMLLGGRGKPEVYRDDD